MDKKLKQYSGALTADQLAQGMNLANRNACRLYDDAKLLLDAGRFSSAMSLAILAIEEAGKVAILRRMTGVTSPDQLKALWREYRSHTAKNVSWTLVDHVDLQGGTRLRDLAPMHDPSSNHPYVLDKAKQLAFYTDCLGQGQGTWTYPDDAVSQELAESIVTIARTQTTRREVTARELELWQTHVGDATRFATQRQGEEALAAWYAAMQADGLYEPGPNRMQEFIEHGLATSRVATPPG